MEFIDKYIGGVFLSRRFYISLAGSIALFLLAYFIPLLTILPFVFLFALIVFFIGEYFMLFFAKRLPSAKRIIADRLSLAEENKIEWLVQNAYNFPVYAELIDEFPEQFQLRNYSRKIYLRGRSQKKVSFFLKPLQRGEYDFGDIYLYVSSPVRLMTRRIKMPATQCVPVYPAFARLHKYELISHTTLSYEGGNVRMRKIGQSMEFEQIKDYVAGDDIRTLNWKASARKGGLMVNSFMEERSQQVYCIIDKGRLMKMPFDGLTLLDYAINSILVLSNVCLRKQDRVGLITFSNKVGNMLPADRKPVQMENILQMLYKQETDFLESDFEMLYKQIRNKIRHRSLLILFTNFESLSGLNRQVDYLRSIAKHHLLMVVFFENIELEKLTERKTKNVEDVYIQTIAEKFSFEKRLIAKELKKYGILSILSSPQKLTVKTINKYLELKARQAI